MAFFGFGKKTGRGTDDDGEIWLIAGLGNFGDKYRNSRHNAGFMAADSIAKVRGLSFKRHKCRAAVARYDIDKKRVVLAKPLTYMNKSGEAISELLRFYKIPIDHLIVIYDDIDIAEGALRVRVHGGPGTHNGGDLVKYVLGGISQASLEAAKKGALAAEAIVEHDIEYAMREFNSKG